METQLDLLCFGAHPDDVEIGMGGTIHKHVHHGNRVGICNLTQGELSSNGTVTSRQLEAEQAARILGVQHRMNLDFPDRGLNHSPQLIGTIVNLIRRYKPRVVFVPYEKDRHPDHGKTAQLVEEAVFNANIRKYQWGKTEHPPHLVDQVCSFFISNTCEPDVLIDITDHMEAKREALLAYESQFKPHQERVNTRLNAGFLEVIEGRERLFGKMADVHYAEGFVVQQPLLLSYFTDLDRVSPR